MDITPLLRIGLSEGEAKVYLALLECGSSATGRITSASKVSRSKVYEILDRLSEKGLASSTLVDGVNHYSAIDPRLVPELLDKRKNEIDEQKLQFTDIIPSLLAKAKEKALPHQVEVFTSWQGIRNAFDTAFQNAKKGDKWYAFGIPEQLNQQRARFFAEWRKRSDKIGVTHYLIANENIRNSPELAPKSKYSHLRFTKQETPTSVDIFKNITFFGIWTKEPLLIVITSQEVADSFRIFFQQLWDKGEKPVRS
jgi:sugar-specific transcriptional regulator TrmB